MFNNEISNTYMWMFINSPWMILTSVDSNFFESLDGRNMPGPWKGPSIPVENSDSRNVVGSSDIRTDFLALSLVLALIPELRVGKVTDCVSVVSAQNTV